MRALDVSGSASRTWTVIIPVTAHEKAVPRAMSESSEAAALVCRQRLSFLRDMSSYVSAWCSTCPPPLSLTRLALPSGSRIGLFLSTDSSRWKKRLKAWLRLNSSC